MKILGIIPARGGSKRLPRKNIAELGGKPLLCWTIDQACNSNIMNELFVSSDDDEILEIATLYYPEIGVRKRPIELAQDDTPMMPVVKDLYDKVQADVIVLLQPTSPFRTGNDIKKSVNLLISHNADSVISTTEAPEDLAFEVGWANRLRKIPNVVVPNGALYLITGEALRRGETWYSGLVYGYSMPKDRSIDIDTPMDLEFARMIVNKKEAA